VTKNALDGQVGVATLSTRLAADAARKVKNVKAFEIQAGAELGGGISYVSSQGWERPKCSAVWGKPFFSRCTPGGLFLLGFAMSSTDAL
jgi:hypothetical protein